MFRATIKTAATLPSSSDKNTTKNNWLAIKCVNNQQELTDQYQQICQQYRLENKWILMIDPQDSSLEQLSEENNINPSKILRIDSKKVKIELLNIESALIKGNYSAIILGNSELKNEQIEQLTACAKQGKTKCVVIKSNEQLH